MKYKFYAKKCQESFQFVFFDRSNVAFAILDPHFASHIVRICYASLETTRTIYVCLGMNIFLNLLIVGHGFRVLRSVTVDHSCLQTIVIGSCRVAPFLFLNTFLFIKIIIRKSVKQSQLKKNFQQLKWYKPVQLVEN